MPELKTKRTNRSVKAFVDAFPDQGTRRDCRTLLRIMKQVTRATPRMWGPSIVGFGTYHYKYDSGREGDWFVAGFSPRKQNLTIYCMGGFPSHQALMARLGKHTTGKACLYVKRLADIDLDVLAAVLRASVKRVAASGGS